jgi:hypothetical protein
MSRGKRSATSIDVKTYRPSLCPNQQSSPQTDGLPTRVHSAYSLYFRILRNHQQPAQKPTRDRRLNPAIPPIEVFANPVPENHRFGLSLFFSTFNPYLSFCKFGASHASYAPPPGAAIKATPPKKTNGPGALKATGLDAAGRRRPLTHQPSNDLPQITDASLSNMVCQARYGSSVCCKTCIVFPVFD